MRICVIGGGASGMMAALSAREAGGSVCLLERQSRVGRKLLATGNGCCNLTNRSPLPGHYHGDYVFVQAVLSAFPVEEALAYFRSLGLVTVTEPSGRVYPYSDQANSVVDVLRFALDSAGISVRTGCEVRRVKQTKGGFSVTLPEESLEFDRVIIACGGIAGSKLGGSMSGYQLLRALGHRCTKLRPSLVQLRSSFPRMAALKGIRAQCKAEITKDGSLFSQGEGEIQFTEYGLSGPLIFDLSRDACSAPGLWQCRLDLLPQFSIADVKAYLCAKREHLPNLTAADLFTGLLHNRLGRVLTQGAGISQAASLSSLSDFELSQAAEQAKSFTLNLTEPLGMDSAQVTAGGIFTEEFDPTTLESRLVPGLFACGEVLDVDGDCGGYNLQWAWSSGRVAGLSAGKGQL